MFYHARKITHYESPNLGVNGGAIGDTGIIAVIGADISAGASTNGGTVDSRNFDTLSNACPMADSSLARNAPRCAARSMIDSNACKSDTCNEDAGGGFGGGVMLGKFVMVDMEAFSLS
jgi:hypothetical protein